MSERMLGHLPLRVWISKGGKARMHGVFAELPTGLLRKVFIKQLEPFRLEVGGIQCPLYSGSNA